MPSRSMRVPILLALVTFVLLVHSRRTYQRCYCSGGDSPYFLLMARSLALDLDLVMTGDEGSHRLSYLDCPVPLGRRTFSPEIPYITHPIGAPILFALPYRIGGRQGVLIFVACLTVFCSGLLLRYLDALLGPSWGNVAATAWVVLSVPVLPLAVSETTEIPALVCQLVALNLLIAWGPGRGHWSRRICLALSLAVLPWIHLRFAFVTVVLAAWGGLKILGRDSGYAHDPDPEPRSDPDPEPRSDPDPEPRSDPEPRPDSGFVKRLPAIALLMVPLLLSFVGLLAWSWYVLGTLEWTGPFQICGKNSPGSISVTNLLTLGLWGHLTDQQMGLITHAPWVLLSCVGWLRLEIRFRREMTVHLSYLVPTLFLIAGHYHWSGVWGMPCRYLTPMVPFLALGLAWFIKAAGSAASHIAAPHNAISSLAILRIAIPILPLALGSLLISGLYLRFPALQLSLHGPGVNLDSIIVCLHLHFGLDLMGALPRFLWGATSRDYALAVSLLAGSALWIRWILMTLDGKRTVFHPVVLAAWFTGHILLSSVLPASMGNPLSEHARWAGYDHEYLLSYPLMYERLATKAIAAGDAERAVRCLERILDVDEDFLRAYPPLVKIYLARGEPSARALAQKGLRLAERQLTHTPEALKVRGLLRLYTGDLTGSRRDLIQYRNYLQSQSGEVEDLLE